MPTAPDPIRAGSLPGRLVIVTRDGSVEGICRKAVEDPFLGRVLGFAFEDDEWYEGPKFVPQQAVVGYGVNALLIEDRSQVLELHQAAEIRLILKQREGFIEKHVMTDAGKYLGEIFDYDFNAAGLVTTYYIHRYLAGEHSAYLLPADRTTRVGKNLVLVADGALTPTELRPAIRAPWEGAGEPRITPTAKTLHALQFQPPAEEEPVTLPGRTITATVPSTAHTEGLADRFNERQLAYLLGRRCERDILDDGGTVLIRQGHLIDESAIAAARSAGKFMELAISSRTGGTLVGQPQEGRGAA
ncbi:MAG TPA: hypothetical protein VEI97_17420 [bacterium]|nr:hypothetical protein [bacterium]